MNLYPLISNLEPLYLNHEPNRIDCTATFAASARGHTEGAAIFECVATLRR